MFEEEKEANEIIASLKKALKNVRIQSWKADGLGNIRGKYGYLVVVSAKIPDRPSMPNAVVPRLVDAEFIAAANPRYSEALSSCNNLKAQVTKIIDELDPEARNFIFLNKTECIADAGSRMVDVGEQLTKMNGGK